MMIWIKRLFKAILFVIVAYAAGRVGIVFFSSQLIGERAPYLQSLTQDSVTVQWQTRENRMGVLKYGLHPDHLNYTLLEESVGKVHSITANMLQPDTLYYYSVGDISGYKDPDPEHDWFRTMPADGSDKPARIWIIGDSGQPGEISREVRDAMLGWVEQNPRENDDYINLWIGLGDLAYRSGTNAQFQKGLFDTYADILRNQAIWPVYGNHDARRWTYFKLFTLPEYGEAGGVPSGTENYYSIDYANVHVVVLDSTDSGLDPDDDMLEWLKEDLANNSSKWLIVAFHHPPYTKGSHNSDDPDDSNGRMIKIRQHVLPILEAAAADLVLSGHSHMYERSHLMDCHYGTSDTFSEDNIVSKGQYGQFRRYRKPAQNISHTGTVYAVVGSSSRIDQGPLDHPAMVVAMEEAGSLIIDVDGSTMTTRFITNNGEIKDEFTIEKKNGLTSPLKPCVIPGSEPEPDVDTEPQTETTRAG